MKRWQRGGLALGVGGGVVAITLYAALEWYRAGSQRLDFFEDEIAAFEALPTPEGRPIVFVGSSSIRLWDTLDEDMYPLPVLNRGFGGAQMSHVLHNASRIVTPLRPRAVLVYAGDNDLDVRTGKNAAVVVDEFQQLVERVHAEVPDARVYFLSIKPSKLRWARWPEMQRANRAIREWVGGDPRLHYVDVSTPMLAEDGQPRDDVFLFDGLHLNSTGYAVWSDPVRAALLRDERRE